MAPLEVVDSISDDGYSPSSNFENQVLIKTIMQAIREELTEDQRHVIILRFLEGFSLRETANIVGKQVNYVKVIQNRGIAALRKLLGYEENK
jgi:RNA polymerase sigma-70 factor (ECF subfamily)